MCARAFIVAALLAMVAPGYPASAAAPPSAYVPPPPPPPPGVPIPTAAQVDELQQRLLASQQTIATLERQLADLKNRSVAMDQCRVKNGRLVFIGRELIEGYERRYRDKNSHDPLQLGRRRFEFELQALSDAVYDNRVDVPGRVPGENRAPDTPATPAVAPAAGTSRAPTSASHPPTKDK